MDVDEIVQLLEDIASLVSNWREVGTALRKQGVEDNREHPLWKYIFAFEYMYVEDSNKDYFERYGVFAPWIEMQGGVFPPPLITLADDILSEWTHTLEKVQSHVISSRLADLLWVRKWGNRPDLYARQAIDSYLDVSKKDNWTELDLAFCLARALDLSKEINDVARKNGIIAKIIDAAYNELRSEHWKPGVSLRLIESLMSLQKNEIPREVDNLLNLAIKVYEKDIWIVENILILMMSRANAKEQKDLQLYQINKSVEEADKVEKGLMQLHHLEHALELARNYGFQEVADQIRRMIQSIPDEELGLKTFSVKVEIPTEKLENYLNWFVHHLGWKESFIRFGFHGPPSGDHKTNTEDIEKQANEFPLQFLVTRGVYDEHNAPVRYGRNLDDNKAIALVNHETMGIRLFSTSAPEILQRIKNKHGLPPIDELSEFFTTSIISKDISGKVARAINWYFAGEFDVAAHLLVPRIENIIRMIAREVGLPIIREPVGSTPGGVIQLGNLLTMLQDRIDESWRRYLYNLLVNPIGVNLRNRICHGLLAEATKEDAALLIHAVSYLRLIQITENEHQENHEQ